MIRETDVNSGIAQMLSGIANYDVTPVDGGFRIKETDTHYVDALRMLLNWRITTTPKDFPTIYDRYWCYAGNGFVTLLEVVERVAEWDGSDDTEPAGWTKNGQTGEYRPDGA